MSTVAAHIKQIREQEAAKPPRDWQKISNLTLIAMIGVLATFTLVISNGTTKEKTV